MLLNVIHNIKRTDRFNLLCKEIESQNLYVRLWPAITDRPHPWQNIAAAHKQIIRWAKWKKLKEVAIAEDDVHFIEGGWDYFIEHKPAEFDIYLAATYGGIISSGSALSKHNALVVNFSTLHCYIIHEKFYDKFLMLPEKMNIDVECNMQHPFSNYKVCLPMVAVQHNTKSNNGDQEINHDHYLKQIQITNQNFHRTFRDSA